MKLKIIIIALALSIAGMPGQAQKIRYTGKWANEHHPEIGYWFISPSMLEGNRPERYLDSVADNSLYTLLFLSAREGADFYDFGKMHDIFRRIVAEGHRRGLKIGLQLWGDTKDVPLDVAERMIVEQEVQLSEAGNADYTAKARYIRFPDRLLKTSLFRVYAFRKTADGFYDPATLRDITDRCEAYSPDRQSVEVRVRGGASVKGLTACIMTEEYCSQSSSFGQDEIDRFTRAMQAYGDIPFDGFALDEYGNKFVARPVELKGEPFRGRWYSPAMDSAFRRSRGGSLVKTLFDGRYAPQGKPEVRMRAINVYMDFMRRGALRIETAVYKKSREIFGSSIFNGIHDTYHNSLVNDEIWANGIAWWEVPRAYGQTDEKTSLPIQMGVAMAHPMNAMYNQYYDVVIPHVINKALTDLRYGVRTHYHALNDKRPNRSDLEDPEAVAGIDRVENCARLLNKLNPRLPDVRLLVIFGREALSDWYPNVSDRGVYDINDKLGIEEKVKEIWNAGYLNALVPSDLITDKKLTIGADGRPVLNGHRFDAVLYLYPQYAREEELKFLEEYVRRGGKLMLEGSATHDFMGKDISARFDALRRKATVAGYSLKQMGQLGLHRNDLADGCKTEDGTYVFTDTVSLNHGSQAGFRCTVNGHVFSGSYRGLIALSPGPSGGVQRLAAAGLTELRRDGEMILQFAQPTDVFIDKRGKEASMIIRDVSGKIRPLVDRLGPSK